MKARTEVLELELRRKTDIEDRVRATALGLQQLTASMTSQFAESDKRWGELSWFGIEFRFFD